MTQKEGAQWMNLSKEVYKEAKIAEESKLKMKSCLNVANAESGMRRRERDKARADALQWRKSSEHENRVRNEKELNEELVTNYRVIMDENKELIYQLSQQYETIEKFQQEHNDASYYLRRAE
ncbi:hypothetical protein VNO78_09527 [Psophocarpus tetragonolobus]|uniref:Uncharacterized protein n=1 Tax=Psophocarpus tetragonolobus TaxID=3891 RepID=A0AAN9XU42_PSOTE